MVVRIYVLSPSSQGDHICGNNPWQFWNSPFLYIFLLLPHTRYIWRKKTMNPTSLILVCAIFTAVLLYFASLSPPRKMLHSQQKAGSVFIRRRRKFKKCVRLLLQRIPNVVPHFVVLLPLNFFLLMIFWQEIKKYNDSETHWTVKCNFNGQSSLIRLLQRYNYHIHEN